MWSYDPDNLENLRGFITFGDHARIRSEHGRATTQFGSQLYRQWSSVRIRRRVVDGTCGAEAPTVRGA